MKVLQINCVYNYGSTGKITCDIHRFLLENGEESLVCYGRGSRTGDPGVTKTCSELCAKANNLLSRIRGTMYGGCHLATWKLIRIIQREKPDVVHLQCINGYFVNIYKLLTWLKQSRIKTVLTLHAEFMYTANCGYALDCEKWRTGCGSCPRLRQETLSWFRDGTASSFRQMREAFQGFEKNLAVISVSPWLCERAAESPILKDMRHRVILNGLDTEVFSYRPGTRIRRELGIGGRLIFHATPMFSDDPAHLKGGWYLLELAKRMPEVRFLVAGKQAVKGAVPENVTLLGEVRDQNRLAELYSAADLTLLTSKKETFSMVCAESLCCGTPVVGFEAGAPERISLGEYSGFVKPGDLDALEAAAEKWLNANPFGKERISADGKKRYARRRMCEEYMDVYRGLVNEASS